MNFIIFFVMISLISIGIIMLYSAADGNLRPWAYNQFLRAIFFLPIFFTIIIINFQFIFQTAYAIYIISIILLIITEFFGVTTMGAQRWISIGGFNFQTSEFAKIGLILALSKYYATLNPNLINRIYYGILIPIGIGVIPFFLVYLQPNLGTCMILLVLTGVIMFLSGVNRNFFILVIIVIAISIPVIWEYGLHTYQKERVLNFLDPNRDVLGGGYNIIQSKIAIGSAGFFGKGYLQGTQNKLDFIPEKQTDFIFSIFIEEFGLFSGVILVLLYAYIFIWSILLSLRLSNLFQILVTLTISSSIFIHMFINLSMSMGMMPATGIPLPFLSYGGSFLIFMMIHIALLLNIQSSHDIQQ